MLQFLSCALLHLGQPGPLDDGGVVLVDVVLVHVGVDAGQAEKDACLIEHYISSESMEKLAAFVEAEGGEDS